MRRLNMTVQYQKTAEKVGAKKVFKIFNFLGGFFRLNFNSQSDFVLISLAFFNMASRNETPPEIYPGFSQYVIWNFLFQRQFYQPGGSQ